MGEGPSKGSPTFKNEEPDQCVGRELRIYAGGYAFKALAGERTAMNTGGSNEL
jgi:hypothetical protein